MGQPDTGRLRELLEKCRYHGMRNPRVDRGVAMATYEEDGVEVCHYEWPDGTLEAALATSAVNALEALLDQIDRQREALEGCREIALRECRDEDEARNALHGRGLIFRLCDRALGGDDHE